MSTTALIVMAIAFYVVFAVANSRAGGRIDPSLSSVIFNGLGALLPLALYLALRLSHAERLVATRPSGLVWSTVAGVAIAGFSVALITIYGRGGSLSYVVPTVYGAAVALSAVVGWVVFREGFSTLHALGVATVVGGIALLALPVR
jgi:drug/metabolite transporter (DMT)-like permease